MSRCTSDEREIKNNRAMELASANAHAMAGVNTLTFEAVTKERSIRKSSLIPGLGVKLSANILAGPTVLSAAGACPPHDGVRRRWWINVASLEQRSDHSDQLWSVLDSFSVRTEKTLNLARPMMRPRFVPMNILKPIATRPTTLSLDDFTRACAVEIADRYEMSISGLVRALIEQKHKKLYKPRNHIKKKSPQPFFTAGYGNVRRKFILECNPKRIAKSGLTHVEHLTAHPDFVAD